MIRRAGQIAGNGFVAGGCLTPTITVPTWSPGGYTAVPRVRAKWFLVAKRKMDVKKTEKLKEELKRTGGISLKTDTTPGRVFSVAMAAKKFASACLKFAGTLGFGPNASAAALAAAGSLFPAWIAIGIAGVGVITSARALWKLGKEFKNKKKTIEAGAKAGRERAEIDLREASEPALVLFLQGYRRASNPEEKELSEEQIQRLPEFTKQGYEAYLLSRKQPSPNAIASYQLALEAAMVDYTAVAQNQVPPTPQAVNQLPQATTQPQASAGAGVQSSRGGGSGSGFSSGARTGFVQATPDSVRQVAQAVGTFKDELEALKVTLIQALGGAREGWSDSRGDKAEADITEMLASLDISEEAQGIEDKCTSLAEKLENL